VLDGNGRLLVVEKEKMDAIREVLGGFEAPSCIGACVRVGGCGWVGVGGWVWVLVSKERDFEISRPSKKIRNFLFFPKMAREVTADACPLAGLTARRSLVSAQTASSSVAAAVVSRLYCFTAYVSIRQHTSACCGEPALLLYFIRQHTSAYVSMLW
jgi:hypothetical protein